MRHHNARSTRYDHHVINFESLKNSNLFDVAGNGHFRVIVSPNIGRSLQARNLNAGTIGLFVGKCLEQSNHHSKKKEIGLGWPNFRYMISGYHGQIIDATPPAENDPNFSYYFASLINEISTGMDDTFSYNCELGLMNVSSFVKNQEEMENINAIIPDLNLAKKGYWPYFEIMVPIEDEWTDLYMYYSWSTCETNKTHIHNRTRYESVNPEGRLHPKFGNHLGRSSSNLYREPKLNIVQYIENLYDEATVISFQDQKKCPTAEQQVQSYLENQIPTNIAAEKAGLNLIKIKRLKKQNVKRVILDHLQSLPNKKKKTCRPLLVKTRSMSSPGIETALSIPGPARSTRSGIKTRSMCRSKKNSTASMRTTEMWAKIKKNKEIKREKMNELSRIRWANKIS